MFKYTGRAKDASAIAPDVVGHSSAGPFHVEYKTPLVVAHPLSAATAKTKAIHFACRASRLKTSCIACVNFMVSTFTAGRVLMQAKIGPGRFAS
ncbi:MAG: hypothetical protein WCO56_20405 [Verrucomicrobiota bacterium]